MNKLEVEPRKKRQKKLNQGDFMIDSKKKNNKNQIDPNSLEYQIDFTIGTLLAAYISVRVVIKGVRVILKYLA